MISCIILAIIHAKRAKPADTANIVRLIVCSCRNVVGLMRNRMMSAQEAEKEEIIPKDFSFLLGRDKR